MSMQASTSIGEGAGQSGVALLAAGAGGEREAKKGNKIGRAM
jgi:hypothetical protein